MKLDALKARLSKGDREVYKLSVKDPRWLGQFTTCWVCKGEVRWDGQGPLAVRYLFTRKAGSKWEQKRVTPVHLGCLFRLTALP